MQTEDEFRGKFFLDSGETSAPLKMGFEDRTVICERKELKRIVTFLIKVLVSFFTECSSVIPVVWNFLEQ